MNRRDYLRLCGGAAASTFADHAAGLSIKTAPGHVVAASGAAPGVELSRDWKGDTCRAVVTNRGKQPVAITEVVLFAIAHSLPAETILYGESFQMLSQTAGTLGAPMDLGYNELNHYKLAQPEGVTVATGLLTLTPPGADTILLGYTSCKRFNGRFYLRPETVEAVLDTEGLLLEPGEWWELEELIVLSGRNRAELLSTLADRIVRNQPSLQRKSPPTGWCSWYCFGPRVTAKNVIDNLDVIAKNVPSLRYIQIDDGYQPAMGDWLETGKAFGGDIKTVLQEIHRRNFEPAIWVAPFIAEEKSHLFQEHPEWFIQSAAGNPLASHLVTFGGWRHGPWYALDGTNPYVQKHLTSVFRTMRNDWGCTYFKLDANFWGAMHGGRFHDRRATRIEAYRRGMRAILNGAGDSFILGCNHPIWPSFGLIHGSRSSADIKRTWDVIQKVARQNLNRNWQDGRLWWNDPDAVVLTGTLPENEFVFHATAVYASGGMILSGDDLTTMSSDRLAILRKLLPPTGIAATFQDESLRVGTVQLKDQRMICLFNWKDEFQTITAALPRRCRITDYWNDRDLGGFDQAFTATAMPPHSARLLSCR